MIENPTILFFDFYIDFYLIIAVYLTAIGSWLKCQRNSRLNPSIYLATWLLRFLIHFASRRRLKQLKEIVISTYFSVIKCHSLTISQPPSNQIPCTGLIFCQRWNFSRYFNAYIITRFSKVLRFSPILLREISFIFINLLRI